MLTGTEKYQRASSGLQKTNLYFYLDKQKAVQYLHFQVLGQQTQLHQKYHFQYLSFVAVKLQWADDGCHLLVYIQGHQELFQVEGSMETVCLKIN